jgi:hypothetical protein
MASWSQPNLATGVPHTATHDVIEAIVDHGQPRMAKRFERVTK